MDTLTFNGQSWDCGIDLARYLRQVSFYRFLDALPAGIYAIDVRQRVILASWAWQMGSIATEWAVEDFGSDPSALLVVKMPKLVPVKPRLVPDPFPPCCPLAIEVPCVCSRHWRCPEHGDRSYGTHD